MRIRNEKILYGMAIMVALFAGSVANSTSVSFAQENETMAAVQLTVEDTRHPGTSYVYQVNSSEQIANIVENVMKAGTEATAGSSAVDAGASENIKDLAAGISSLYSTSPGTSSLWGWVKKHVTVENVLHYGPMVIKTVAAVVG